ncbi:cytochrome b5 domain-containing protein [Candidatus Woesearchaeota archaeon]|nr:cytochrome b5 domain-containing protein [Candidatus Woesearchaeota archaeon]
MMKKTLFLTIIFLAVILIGCEEAQQQTAPPRPNGASVGVAVTIGNGKEETPMQEPEVIGVMDEMIGISISELATHNSRDDCWLSIDGHVYDVTAFIGSHPGGEAILQGCGTDATTLFETRPMGSGKPHSDNARILLETYYIGDLG